PQAGPRRSSMAAKPTGPAQPLPMIARPIQHLSRTRQTPARTHWFHRSYRSFQPPPSLPSGTITISKRTHDTVRPRITMAEYWKYKSAVVDSATFSQHAAALQWVVLMARP